MADMNLTARWVFPVSGPPIERGVVVVSGTDIVAVEPHGSRKADVDFGNSAVVPGFVNAHAHLDLTGARGLTPPTSDFTDWLRKVITYRKTRTPEQVDADIRAGIAESLRHGTTLLGDISSDGRSYDILGTSPIWSTVFLEVLGLSVERTDKAFENARDWIRRNQRTKSKSWSSFPGLSPHAPYSTSLRLFNLVFNYNRRYKPFGFPIAIHLAESRDESELLASRKGPFVDFLDELGVWGKDKLVPSAQDLIDLTRFRRFRWHTLFIHCNYLPTETRFPTESSIVYCPRTHAAFDHPPHPFREFQSNGVRVVLGTDSLASNPDLSVLAEARFVANRYPDFDRAGLLRMATLAGAKAIGGSLGGTWADLTGSLDSGKFADFAVVALPDRDDPDPHDLFFNSDRPVQSTWIRGERVFNLSSAT